MDKSKTLNCHYDREEDILYVTLGDSDSALCIEQGNGFLVRIDPESGEVMGFTVIDFSLRAAERVAITGSPLSPAPRSWRPIHLALPGAV